MLFEMNEDGDYLFVHTPPLPHGYTPLHHGSPEGLVGKNIRDIVDPEGAELAISQIRRTLESGQVETGTWSRKFPDGVRRHHNARSVRSDRGTVIVLVRDVTEEVNRAETLERSNEDLRQFAYVVSHDLQEPLRGLVNATEVLREEMGSCEKNDEITKWMGFVQNDARRMQKMISHLLEYSRAGTMAIQPEDFEAKVELDTILHDFRQKIAETGASIEIVSLPRVHYDRMMFRLVFSNLLSNALKFTKEGEAPKVRISGAQTIGDMSSISVQDEGVGIPKEAHRTIFGIGKRLHHRKDYPGFGYGLAIVARVLRRCGGSLGVRSTEGQGSEFVVTLPSARAGYLEDLR